MTFPVLEGKTAIVTAPGASSYVTGTVIRTGAGYVVR
jgi:hypothetical protein